MRADAPVYLSETTRMVASIIREVGTPVMRDRILAGAMNGDITIALGFTEPGAAPTSPQRPPKPCATVTIGSSTARRCSPPTGTLPTTCSC